MLKGTKVIDNKGNKGIVIAVIEGIELNIAVELEDGTRTAYNEQELQEVKEDKVEQFIETIEAYGCGAIAGNKTKKYTHRSMTSGNGITIGKKGLMKFIEANPDARLFENQGNKVVELNVNLFLEKGWMVEL